MWTKNHDSKWERYEWKNDISKTCFQNLPIKISNPTVSPLFWLQKLIHGEQKSHNRSIILQWIESLFIMNSVFPSIPSFIHFSHQCWSIHSAIRTVHSHFKELAYEHPKQWNTVLHFFITCGTIKSIICSHIISHLLVADNEQEKQGAGLQSLFCKSHSEIYWVHVSFYKLIT